MPERLSALGSTAWDTRPKSLDVFIRVACLTFMSYLNFFGLLERMTVVSECLKRVWLFLEEKAVQVVKSLNDNSDDNDELIELF